jgi:nucleoside-triphosphatase
LEDAKNILITGRPRVGKTTLIKRLATALGSRAGGFYTEEVPGEGVRGRRGFRIVTLDGRDGTLADVDIGTGPHVGKYGVNLADLDAIGVAAIEEAMREREWIVIDEIGKMEEFSARFRSAVTHVLDSGKRVLATIRRNDSTFTAGIKSRPDIRLIGLTVPNREEIASELMSVVSLSI